MVFDGFCTFYFQVFFFFFFFFNLQVEGQTWGGNRKGEELVCCFCVFWFLMFFYVSIVVCWVFFAVVDI